MLPLEFDNPGLFGDDLQFVPGGVTFLHESTGVAVRIALVPAGRPGGVRAAGRPEASLAMAGVVAGARAGFHWTSLKMQRIVNDETRSKREF
jgi:hypothetical protein